MDYSLWGALATSFVICAASGPVLIPLLHKLKFGQSIRDCGPQAHQKKSGTPTMGGFMILTAVLVAVLVWCKLTPAVLIALLLTMRFLEYSTPNLHAAAIQDNKHRHQPARIVKTVFV